LKVFHAPQSALHAPKLFYRRGKLIDAPEQPARYQVLRDAAAAAGHELHEPTDHGLAPIAAAHDGGYLAFLRDAWGRRGEIDPTLEELVATQFARVQMHRGSAGLINQLGFYTADTSTPIRAETWTTIYHSAQAAIGATDAALNDGVAYALCRPPGHHAFTDCAGGFCYLNNTAIAAQRLRDLTGARVAILDVDVHHGNGTQGIFYRRNDVLTVSIHADTSNYFPLYAGYADERGEGDGEGFNLNLPLAHGAGDAEVIDALDVALDRIKAFGAETLVVALGLDAAAADPLGVFNVSAAGFQEISRRASAIGLPSVLVQEGGYLCDDLPLNLVAALRGFER
jgi:acetoin utilization deacetylase AcuC-like enzyme